MADFIFNGSGFYYSPVTSDTLLKPLITQPDFIDLDTYTITKAPGLVELLSGDLGISELIIARLTAPSMAFFDTNDLVAKMYAEMRFPEDIFPAAIATAPLTGAEMRRKAKMNYLRKALPKDAGMKGLEKSLVTSMVEAQKPLLELAKMLPDILAIVEDIICTFLGNSIESQGQQIGTPARNPAYYDESVGYAVTMNYALKNYDKLINDALDVFNKRMGTNHPLNTFTSGRTERKKQYKTPQPKAIYVGYYDKEGIALQVPKWLEDDPKWLKIDYVASDGSSVSIGSPFTSLSQEIVTGTEQLLSYHDQDLQVVDRTINDAVEATDDATKADILQHVTGLRNHMESVLRTESTTQNSTVLAPLVLDEWLAKTRCNQLRQKYYPAMVSTVQTIVDSSGLPVAPYLYIPTYIVNYKDRDYRVEVPLAIADQITQTRQPGNYNQAGNSLANQIASLDLYSNAFPEPVVEEEIVVEGSDSELVELLDPSQFTSIPLEAEIIEEVYVEPEPTIPALPYEDDEVTYFSHNITGPYVPDLLKNYILPLRWYSKESVDVIDNSSGNVIRQVTEMVPHLIDVENDYELRLIQVFNYAAEVTVNENAAPVIDNTLTDVSITPIDANIDPSLPSLPNTSGVPDVSPEPAVIPVPLISTPDIDPSNMLKEGVMFQETNILYSVDDSFWIVEAIRRDENGLTAINDIYNSVELTQFQLRNDNTVVTEEKGKKWYTLLDKYQAIPKIISRLMPVVFQKCVPMLVQLMAMMRDPARMSNIITQLLITNEGFSKLPQHYPAFGKGLIDFGANVQAFKVPQSYDESRRVEIPKGRFFYAGFRKFPQRPIANPLHLLDGQAVTVFGRGALGYAAYAYGINLNASDNQRFTFITSKNRRTDFTAPPVIRDQPIFGLLLNFIKLPLEVTYMAAAWMLEWFKDLFNPKTMPKAVETLLSFEWMKNILSKDSLYRILGIEDPVSYTNQLKELYSSLITVFDDSAHVTGTNTFSRRALERFNEVLVYNIYRNGQYVRSETEENPLFTRPYDFVGVLNTFDIFIKSRGLFLNQVPGTRYGSDKNEAHCGIRQFDVNALFPNPFWSEMPRYNSCEVANLGVKPLQMIQQTLHLIQEVLNAYVSMPVAIFGLEETVSIPRFGQQIPFAEVFDELLLTIREQMK